MDLKHYLAILRRWGWILVLCTVTATVASYWTVSRQPKTYESRARYLVGPAIDNPNVDSAQLRAAVQVGYTYADIATSRPIIQKVIDQLGLDIDTNTLAKNVNVVFIEGTMMLTIRVQASNPETAALVANAVGEALIERSPGGPSSVQAAQREEARAQITRLQERIRSIEGEIDTLNNQIQQATDELNQRTLIVRLDERRGQLAAAQRALSDQYAILQGSSANQIAVVEPALPDSWPVAPQVGRTVLAAILAGLVLGIVIMLLCEYFMDVIYLPQELRKATGLAYLGGIARHKKLRGPGVGQLVVKARPETLAAESYRILRTNLQLPSAGNVPQALLITSPMRGDGKSEIAANLAVSFALAGNRVILIDANLRRPRLANLFELSNQDGLAGLLKPGGPLPRPMPIATVPNLAVLASSTPVASSSEILASARMTELIQECKRRADVVVVDSPPLLYSDALALAPQVDGVILVVNSGTTGVHQTVNAVESLRLVGANLLGAVLNRVKPGAAYNYYPLHAQKPDASLFGSAVAWQDGSTVQLLADDHERATQPLAVGPVADVSRGTNESSSNGEAGGYSDLLHRLVPTKSYSPENDAQTS